MVETLKKPIWLKAAMPGGEGYQEVRATVGQHRLHTVCESAQCPNLGECWGRGTATLMILGDICTRACGFCAVKTGKPTGLDLDEPRRVAEAVKLMRLRHVVVTSVTRDDLKDGGAGIWARTIHALRRECPSTRVEILVPDFMGNQEAWRTVFEARPDIFSHNAETVPRLAPRVRSAARWPRSLELLRAAGRFGLTTKSGLMLGLGEAEDEVASTLLELRSVGVEVVTLGQYLRPSQEHLPVAEYIHPDRFRHWKEWGLKQGFKVVESGPLVRSSYHAEEQSEGLRLTGA